MPWDKDPDRAFPSRHPREPGGLRQDILDEIADHLASAAEREAERGDDDDETVWRRVLERFGNPDAIARRLWWDQMRETVMREWIQTGVMVVVGVAAVAGVVFMGLMLRQFGATNEAVLQALSSQNGAGDARWATLEVEFRRGAKDGPLAEGVEAKVTGQMFAQEGSAEVAFVSDSGGRFSFGPASPGEYWIYIVDPVSSLELSKNVVLFPKQETEILTIVVPDVAPRPVGVDFNIPISTDAGRQRLLVETVSTWAGGGETWRGRQVCLFGPDGGVSVEEGIQTGRSGGKSWLSGDFAALGARDIAQFRYPVMISGAPDGKCRVALLRNDGDDLFRGAVQSMSLEAVSDVSDGALHAVIDGDLADTLADWALYDQLSAEGLSVSKDLVGAIRRQYPAMSVTATLPVAASTIGAVSDRRFIVREGDGDAVYEDLFLSNSGQSFEINDVTYRIVWNPVVQLSENPLADEAPGTRLVLALSIASPEVKEFNNPLEAWSVYSDTFGTEWPELPEFPTLVAGGVPNLQLGDGPLDSLGSEQLQKVGWQFLDVTGAYADPSAPAHALLLQWKYNGEDYKNLVKIVSAEAKEINHENSRPLWLVLAPKAEAGDS